MLRTLAPLLTLFAAVCSSAQTDRVPWHNDPQRAVAEARQTNRPLMVYVLAATKDRDNKLEHAHGAALNNPRVLRLTNRFVPLKLSRSQHRDVLKDFGLPESANMMMSFVTPDGKLLGDIGAGGIAQAESLATKLVAVLRAFALDTYQTQVKPILTAEDAKADEVKKALRLVAELRITAAEKDLLALLDRERLDAALRGPLCETLAALSTQAAVDKLLDLSGGGDLVAAKALEKCTPAGAELLLDHLQPDADSFDYPLYKVIAGICDIRQVKAERWFEKAKPKARQDEVERITKLVHAAAERWREANDVTD